MSAERVEIPEDEAERRRIQRKKNQPMIDLLREWAEEEGDPHNDAEMWELFKAGIDANRPEGQKLFRD
jgi:hypothetical protein